MHQVLTWGEESSPRGQKTREVRPFVFQLRNPVNRLVTLPGRKVNEAFAIVEAFQLVAGECDTDQQVRFNSNIGSWLNEFGDIEVPYGLAVRDQLQGVLEVLRADPDTRQAVLSIYNGREHRRELRNVPCTCTLQFFVRNGRLEMTVYMRSNDLWWGLPYDVFQFTALQEMVAKALSLPMGTYTHVAGSGHLYEPFYEKASELVGAGWQAETFGSLFSPDEDFEETRRHVKTVLTCERAAHLGQGMLALEPDLPDHYRTLLQTLIDYNSRKQGFDGPITG